MHKLLEVNCNQRKSTPKNLCRLFCQFGCTDLLGCRLMVGIFGRSKVKTDKVWMYEEIMTNDDNLESNLLTFSLLKMCSLLQVELEICVEVQVEVNVAGELLIFI